MRGSGQEGSLLATSLVLTAIGADKPGLVELLSQTVTDHGGNWLESRMSHLAGQFAGILRVSVPESRVDELRAALERLDAQGLRTVVEVSAEAAQGSIEESAGWEPITLEFVGHDRPGIVRDVSRALASRSVNVEELRSEFTSGAMSGEALFKATARLRLPTGLEVEDLRASLEEIANDLMVDVRSDD